MSFRPDTLVTLCIGIDLLPIHTRRENGLGEGL
jgi:hypothetical protein